jgi:hypothetical protein
MISLGREFLKSLEFFIIFWADILRSQPEKNVSPPNSRFGPNDCLYEDLFDSPRLLSMLGCQPISIERIAPGAGPE